MSQSRARQPSAPARARSLLDLAIEGAWLAGVGLIPVVYSGRGWLVFAEQPKQFVLHFVALFIAVAWAFDLALGQRRVREAERRPVYVRLSAWAGRNPGRWAVIVVAAFGVVVVLSTLMSPAPAVSVWGRDFSQLGYELYSQLSLLVIFFAVALRLRGWEQARRLSFVFAGVGSLVGAYGVAQHFGWDAFGPGAGSFRVHSSLLNPIFLGAYLVLTSSVTLAVAISEYRRERWWWLPLGAALLGVQLAALWFTGSRGPWLGSVTGGAAFLVIGAVWLDRRTLALAAVVAVAALLVPAALARIPAGAGARALGDLGRAVSEAAAAVEDTVAAESVVERETPIEGLVPARAVGRASNVAPGPIAGAPGDVFTAAGLMPSEVTVAPVVAAGGLRARVDIWRGALELARTWEREPADKAVAGALRPVLGFGPEMYHYSYPLTASPQLSFMLIAHAHNYLLHVLLELGALGLLAFVTLALLALTAGFRALRSLRGGGPGQAPVSILLVGVLAALVGRAVEQMSGVARIGDLAPFWALMGLVIALGEFGTDGGSTEPVRRARRRRAGRSEGPSWTGLAPLGAAAGLAVLAAVVFIGKDVQQLRASRLAARAHGEIEAGNGTAAFNLLQRAGDLAPDAELYPVLSHELLWSGARAETDPVNKLRQLQAGYDVLARYEKRDPFSFMTQERLAVATVDLFESGDTGRRQEVAERYRRLAAALPPYPGMQALAANGLIIGEDFEGAFQAAERALAMEPVTGPQPRAWWARGEALARTGQPGGARASFEIAIKRDADGEWGARSHMGLAAILELEGDQEAAAEHRERAAEILPALRTEAR